MEEHKGPPPFQLGKALSWIFHPLASHATEMTRYMYLALNFKDLSEDEYQGHLLGGANSDLTSNTEQNNSGGDHEDSPRNSKEEEEPGESLELRALLINSSSTSALELLTELTDEEKVESFPTDENIPSDMPKSTASFSNHSKNDKETPKIGMSIMYVPAIEEAIQPTTKTRLPPPPVCKPKPLFNSEIQNQRKIANARLNELGSGGSGSGSNSESGSESYVILSASSYILAPSLPDLAVLEDEKRKVGIQSEKSFCINARTLQESAQFQRPLTTSEQLRKKELLEALNSRVEGERNGGRIANIKDSSEVERNRQNDRKANEGLERMWGMEPTLLGVPSLGCEVDEIPKRETKVVPKPSSTSVRRGGFKKGSINDSLKRGYSTDFEYK